MKRIPICDLTAWNLVRADRYELSMRPGILTLAQRLGWSAVWLVLAGTIWFGCANRIARIDALEGRTTGAGGAGIEGLSESELSQLRETMPPEDYAVIEGAVEAEALRQHPAIRNSNEAFRKIYRAGGSLGAVVFGVCATLPLLAFAMGRLQVARDTGNNLRFRYWNYLPITRSWPASSFDNLEIFVTEDLNFSRARGIRQRGWVWVAQPQRGAHPTFPMLGGLSIGSGEEGPVFVLDRQQSAPSAAPLIPDRVHAFAEAFKSVTGIAYGEPIVPETGDVFGSEGRRGIRTSFTMSVGKPGVAKQTYTSRDEVPPELRGAIDELMARAQREGGGVYTSTTQRITVTDERGNTQVYDSMDEMPPEVRARLKKFM